MSNKHRHAGNVQLFVRGKVVGCARPSLDSSVQERALRTQVPGLVSPKPSYVREVPVARNRRFAGTPETQNPQSIPAENADVVAELFAKADDELAESVSVESPPQDEPMVAPSVEAEVPAEIPTVTEEVPEAPVAPADVSVVTEEIPEATPEVSAEEAPVNGETPVVAEVQPVISDELTDEELERLTNPSNGE